MWPRIFELLLGIWLMMVPVVFAGTASIGTFAARDVAAGSAIVVLSLLSFWRRTQWAHLVTAVVALVVGLAAYFGERPGPPAAQNEITVAIVLLLFAIIPNDASKPPRPWREAGSAPEVLR